MPKINTYACLVCGAHKKEANHWLLVTDQVSRSILFRPWDEEVAARDDAYEHICGEGHALEVLQRWLTTGSIQDPATRPIHKGEEVRI